MIAVEESEGRAQAAAVANARQIRREKGGAMAVVQRSLKTLATLFYYSIATRMPQPPFPGGNLGHWLRARMCRLIFLKCGDGIVVRPHAFFGSGCDIEIGDFSEIGLNAYLNRDVKIGKHVLMGQNVTILTTRHEFENPNIPIHEQGTSERRPVRVGDDVWIGANSILLPGITIGDGAVIGAGSVVTRDIPPFAVVAGNPARVIRRRGERYVEHDNR
jgi:maltose O-acetyltransferase